MSTNERDTHFQGFAKLLWDELIEANGLGSIDVNTTFDDGIDPTNYRLLIAQRAYDLVDHALDHTANEIWFVPEDVPDLTEWPEPPKT